MKARCLSLLIAVTACDGAPPRIEFALGAGAVSVDLATIGPPRTEPQRATYALASGARVTFQSMEDDDRELGRRTAREVASAIAERYELGEGDGEFAHHPCQVPAGAAHCLDGWTVLNGERYVRRGVVLAVDDSLVWVDVSAPESRAAVADRAAERMRATLQWRPASQS